MDMDRLRSLSEVARRGAITEAARALHLTQPALSRRIQLLEEEFGAPLLTRSQKGVKLTELGRLVEEEGRGLVERYERLKEQVGAHLRLERRAPCVSAAARPPVSFLLPGTDPRVPQAARGDPVPGEGGGQPRDRTGGPARGARTRHRHAARCRARTFEVTALGKDPVVLVGARDHPLARRRRVPVAALEGAPLIGFEGDSMIRRLIDDALEDAGVTVDVVMELRSIQSIVRMAALRLGLAFVSRLGLEAAGRGVKEIPVAGLPHSNAALASSGGPTRPSRWRPKLSSGR